MTDLHLKSVSDGPRVSTTQQMANTRPSTGRHSRSCSHSHIHGHMLSRPRCIIAVLCVCSLWVPSEHAAQRPAYCPSWNPLVLPCPLAEDAVQRLEDKLDANVAGQMLARRTIEKAISTNVQRHANFSKEAWNPYWSSIAESIYSPRSARSGAENRAPRPLFMHFSGPTGVGKSLTADMVAESILHEHNDENMLCGKLLVQMNQYSSGHDKHVADHTLAIRRMVAEQLHHCPRSVLIFDEIQRAPEALLDSIIDIFDQSGRSPLLTFPPHQTPVNTSMCIVIAVSDIGSTKLNPDMDRDAAKRAVEEDADRKFQHSRKRALLQNIVPFLPLAPADLEWVANKELKQLGGALAVEYRGVWAGKLTWSKTVPHWMATR